MPLDYYVTTWPRANVAREVDYERLAQDKKWGEQNHSDGTGGDSLTTVNGLGPTDMANLMRDLCDAAVREGRVTWRHILAEEIYEAFAEDDPQKLRTELIQSAAVISAWVEAIDRRPV